MQPQKGLGPFMPSYGSSTTLTVNPFCVVFHLNPVVYWLSLDTRAH